MGAREAMPTLFDFDVADDEPTRPRAVAFDAQLEPDGDIPVALAEWGDDEDATCFDV